ncbi:MAG: GNAT family N-acetyltransferase [Akkermansiaceae bacterium]|nr:GNAT family N-acetyltransferase [Akkermansiaceae bacterium]
MFHLSAWARILAETYGHQPVYLRIMVAGAEAALVPIMEVRSPLTGCRGVSLPFADFAGPLWTAPRQDALLSPALLAVATARKWKHLELRGGSAPGPGVLPIRTYHAHELDLSPGIARLAQQLPASTRRSIRKAEGSGLTLTIGRDPEAMRAFYDLHGRTRRRHGLPPQPIAFFRAIGRHLVEPGLGVIVLAHRAGTPVAGAVFFHSGSRAIYKFGASDHDHWHLRPNHLVMWGAIEHLLAIGCQSLNFGRTSTDDAGLIRFKQSWAGTSTPLDYFRYDTRKLTWLTGSKPPTERLPLVFGHLPLSLNRIAGRLIYPHLD